MPRTIINNRVAGFINNFLTPQKLKTFDPAQEDFPLNLLAPQFPHKVSIVPISFLTTGGTTTLSLVTGTLNLITTL